MDATNNPFWIVVKLGIPAFFAFLALCLWVEGFFDGLTDKRQ